MHHKAHKTKWTVHYIKTGGIERFDTKEGAKIRCFECEEITPVSLIPPIYWNE